MNTLTYFAPVLLHGLIGSFLLLAVLWIVQVIRKDAGVVDIGWTAGVGCMAVYVAIVGEGWLVRRILIAMMGGIWALRLVLYILKDRICREHEDSRYQRLRAHWGNKANRRFFFFFTSQCLLVVLFALPFLPGAQNPTETITLFDMLALTTWGLSMGGEWLADFQLARFRNHPANQGKVCQDGLWNWSRHPNYFFEWIHWFSYLWLALGSNDIWLAVLGPIAMYIFLLKLTGIPHVERESLAKRGEAYREYQRTTHILIPWPKKRNTL